MNTYRIYLLSKSDKTSAFDVHKLHTIWNIMVGKIQILKLKLIRGTTHEAV